MSNRVEIFDTTLRDGEQSPGASMDVREKVQMAIQLDRLGVDIIEAGFPIASNQEFEGVQKVAEAVEHARVAALARALNKDIERAAAALAKAKNPVLHTFLATSKIHMEHKLRMTPEQVLQAVDTAVRLAKTLVPRVEFSAEDSTRSELVFLAEVAQTAIAAGADVINLPDTVGYTTPGEIRAMFEYVIKHAKGSEGAIFSSHNHNDLGLAVANALAAVLGGARQIECTVNGIGERAGNTSLEEVVMAMHTRQDQYPFVCQVRTEEIVPSSEALSRITGLAVPYNKPVVGRNAFAHESGIHQHGMIANSKTYEIMSPESVGRKRSDLVLGKHSGRAGLAKRSEELGYALPEDQLVQLYERFIALADKKKEVFDDDLRMLITSINNESFETYHLQRVNTSGGDLPIAAVQMIRGDATYEEAATGDGPVDAAIKAIEAITGVSGTLEEFRIRAVTPGKEALGEAHITVHIQGRSITGSDASTDIIEAAAKAYVNAINKYLAGQTMPDQNQG